MEILATPQSVTRTEGGSGSGTGKREELRDDKHSLHRGGRVPEPGSQSSVYQGCSILTISCLGLRLHVADSAYGLTGLL